MNRGVDLHRYRPSCPATRNIRDRKGRVEGLRSDSSKNRFVFKFLCLMIGTLALAGEIDA